MKYVIINDVHFNIANLEKATFALRSAFVYALEHKLPVIIAGDLNDTKAIIRGEVMNRLIELFEEFYQKIQIHILIGNHDLLNEKMNGKHSLNFLKPYANLLEGSGMVNAKHKLGFISYQSTPEDFLTAIKRFPKGHTVVCHQGFRGAFMGEYVQDKSSVDPKDVADWTIVSGHYHQRQKLGTIQYLGNPYTINFAEAEDPAKGFSVLDVTTGETAIHELDLPRHVIFDAPWSQIHAASFDYRPNDIIMLRIHGTKADLSGVKRDAVLKKFFPDATGPVRLELVPEETKNDIKVDITDPTKVLNDIIKASDETAARKKQLLALAEELLA